MFSVFFCEKGIDSIDRMCYNRVTERKRGKYYGTLVEIQFCRQRGF